MQVGQWAYCPEEDDEFKIVAFVGDIIMKNKIMGYHKDACEPCDIGALVPGSTITAPMALERSLDLEAMTRARSINVSSQGGVSGMNC